MSNLKNSLINLLTDNSTLFDSYNYPVVYRIINKVNGDCYVGCTRNFKSRKSYHLSQLKRGNHHNKKLQKAYNEIGKNTLVFEILEFNKPDDLLWLREIRWRQKLKPYYNIYIQ